MAKKAQGDQSGTFELPEGVSKEEIDSIMDRFRGFLRILFRGDRMREAGFTMLNSRLRILDQLGRLHNPRMGELASALGITLPSLTSMVSKMESEELLEKCKDREDARAVRIRISAAGRRQIEAVQAAGWQRLARMMSSLNKKERARLLELLEEMNRILAKTQE